MKIKKKPVWVVCGVVLAGLIVGSVFLAGPLSEIRKDFARLGGESYNAVFFSMYPTDNYVEGDYTHFREMQIVRCDYEIPNGMVMSWYMNKAKNSGNTVGTVYLGVDPERIEAEAILKLAQKNPDIAFEVVLAYPQMSYWLAQSEEACDKAVEKYSLLAEDLLSTPNIRVYSFAGEDWLICNKSNYIEDFLTNVEVSQFLMCNSDFLHPYMLTVENIEAEMKQMGDLIDRYRNNPPEYPEANGYDIVFLGDSIIGNYTDSMSVPQVVGALTDAMVYNCGYGGKSAALGEKDDCPLPMIAEALVCGDMSELPEGELVYDGVNAFFKREKKDGPVMFVINYGLNDYFNGYPVHAEDAYDITSYSGALRTAIRRLQEGYPEAKILLNTPNLVMYYECGEEIRSDKGGKLTDYVDAAIQVGQEMDVEILDNYHELPITVENWKQYQTDGCHLNECGRFLLGKRIALRIE